ncbi:MAG: VWA domain-containing protein, partial [Pseudomonadota bacterium]
MAEFHFLRPLWFLAILPLVLLLWFLWRRNRRAGQWATVCDARLLPHILIQRNGRRSPWPLTLFATGGVLAVTALAGPAWEQLPTPVFRTESYLVIALDLSRSMDAADIKPSRLIRARYKLADILELRTEGQTALIVYAAVAFTVPPLTDDTATIASQLPALTTGLVPVQGSHAGRAL